MTNNPKSPDTLSKTQQADSLATVQSPLDNEGSPKQASRGNDDMVSVAYDCPVDHSGTTVYVKGWVKPQSPHPPVVMVHDLGESSASYQSLAEALGSHDFSLYVFDLRGHGRSGRRMGHIPNFESLVTDVLQVVSWIRYKSERRIPLVVGQGIGALIVTYFEERYPEYCHHTVLIAPTFTMSRSMGVLYRSILKMAARLAPRARLPHSMLSVFLSMGGTQLSKKQEEVYHGITYNFAKEVIKALDNLTEIIWSTTVDTMLMAPREVEDFDLVKIKAMIDSHPFKESITVVELSNISSNPLVKPDEIKVVLNSLFPWLEEKLSLNIKR